jgi:alanine dehydrogenase
MGAQVTVINLDIERLRYLDDLYPGRIVTRASTQRKMKSKSVIVDVAVDQGGCIETSRPTTHSDPTYMMEGVLHYCVANMPGIVPRTSTQALTNATLPYLLNLASSGVDAAVRADAGLAKGVNLAQGKVTCRGVAEAHGLRFDPLM